MSSQLFKIITIFAVLLSAGSNQAWAAKKSSKKVQHREPKETYLAVEGDSEATPDVAAPAPEKSTSSPTQTAAKNDEVYFEEVPAQEAKTTPSVTNTEIEERVAKLQKEVDQLKQSVKTSPDSKSFDAVPSEYRDSISKRLVLVQQLIQKHGRAYDYRVYTAQELETILKSLGQPAQAITQTN